VSAPAANGGNAMYEKEISRRDPGCVVFLLDRSDSRKQQWGNSQETLAQGAARELNNILLELLFTSEGEPGRARHYFDVGVFGYGIRPMARGEGVESAFGGKLAGQALVPLPELRDNPITVREVPSPDAGAPPSRGPIWVEAAQGYRTPMGPAAARPCPVPDEPPAAAGDAVQRGRRWQLRGARCPRVRVQRRLQDAGQAP